MTDQRDFVACPLCKQYSHSIGEDRLAEAFLHFQTMFSHRGDGIPTQFVFDPPTRDHAQVLMAAARLAEQERAAVVAWLRKMATERPNIPPWDYVISATSALNLSADAIERGDHLSPGMTSPERRRDGE